MFDPKNDVFSQKNKILLMENNNIKMRKRFKNTRINVAFSFIKLGVQRYVILMLSVFCFSNLANAQVPITNVDSTIIQFSGLVLTNDSLIPLPYTTISNLHGKMLALSDREGFFTFVSRKGDTVVFREYGFVQKSFVIPKDIEGMKYSIVQLLDSKADTFQPVYIKPYPSKQEFDYRMVHDEVSDNMTDQAKGRLSRDKLDEVARQMPMNGSENYQNYMKNYSDRMYWNGQTPPTRLLDPLAWSQFFRAWQDGQFKRKK